MINREIDVYNTYHGSNDSVVSITESEANIRINEQIEHINVVPFSQDEIIDENAYATIEKLEYFGAYDLIDILIGPLITFGIGWLFGFIIGYIWSLIFHPSEEAIVGMAKVIGYLFMILWAGLFCWLTYKYIAISMDLENIISSNIINTSVFQIIDRNMRNNIRHFSTESTCISSNGSACTSFTHLVIVS